MKISEIEAELTQGHCTEEMLGAFQSALKRVPQRSRCQHCYTTAAAMPPQCSKQAIALIEYGLSEHCSSWVDRMRSFDNMAVICEASGDYRTAEKNYFQAILSVDADSQPLYAPVFAAHVMRTEMHLSGFAYTRRLRLFYDVTLLGDEFDQALQAQRFYRLLAEVIIFSKEGNAGKAKASYDAACKMLDPDEAGPLTALLKMHRYTETTGVTREAEAFLNSLRERF